MLMVDTRREQSTLQRGGSNLFGGAPPESRQKREVTNWYLSDHCALGSDRPRFQQVRSSPSSLFVHGIWMIGEKMSATWHLDNDHRAFGLFGLFFLFRAASV